MGQLNAGEVVRLLQSITDNGYLVKQQVRKDAPVNELITALGRAQAPPVRQVLCDILGEKRANAAVPMLVNCLDDVCSGVRGAAADALAKIR